MIPLNESNADEHTIYYKRLNIFRKDARKNKMKNNSLLEEFLNSGRGPWPPSPNEPLLVTSGVS
jgi:hypothetical protein